MIQDLPLGRGWIKISRNDRCRYHLVSKI